MRISLHKPTWYFIGVLMGCACMLATLQANAYAVSSPTYTPTNPQLVPTTTTATTSVTTLPITGNANGATITVCSWYVYQGNYAGFGAATITACTNPPSGTGSFTMPAQTITGLTTETNYQILLIMGNSSGNTSSGSWYFTTGMQYPNPSAITSGNYSSTCNYPDGGFGPQAEEANPNSTTANSGAIYTAIQQSFQLLSIQDDNDAECARREQLTSYEQSDLWNINTNLWYMAGFVGVLWASYLFWGILKGRED